MASENSKSFNGILTTFLVISIDDVIRSRKTLRLNIIPFSR